MFAEPLITMARQNTVHAHRMVRREIGNRVAMNALFQDIAPQFTERPGGYTRVVKIGPRKGDGAPMAFLELVGFEHFFKRAEEPESSDKKSKKASKKDSQTTADNDTGTSD